jgi:hypothetical protein
MGEDKMIRVVLTCDYCDREWLFQTHEKAKEVAHSMGVLTHKPLYDRFKCSACMREEKQRAKDHDEI